MLDALNAREFESLTELLDPAVEFRSVLGAAEGEAGYTGIDGLRQWAEEVDAVWEDWHQEMVVYREVSESQAVAVIRATGRARGSGVPLDTCRDEEEQSDTHSHRSCLAMGPRSNSQRARVPTRGRVDWNSFSRAPVGAMTRRSWPNPTGNRWKPRATAATQS